jgi:prepilin-type processing-associated H-X9-DG protein
MAREGRGLRMVDVFGALFCLVVAGGVLIYCFLPRLGRARDESRKVRCASNLSMIGKGMSMYLNTLGGDVFYSVPAHAFRGDAWLASLYWSGIVVERRVFVCPSTDDDHSMIPPTQAAAGDLNSADAIPSGTISYAGRCRGTSFAHRNTAFFSEAGLMSDLILACDGNERPPNHSDGINAVFFDTHVEFVEDVDPATIGAPGSEYQYLDSGE